MNALFSIIQQIFEATVYGSAVCSVLAAELKKNREKFDFGCFIISFISTAVYYLYLVVMCVECSKNDETHKFQDVSCL